MKKIRVIAILLICVVMIGIITVSADTEKGMLYSAGEFLAALFRNNEVMEEQTSTDTIVASYHGKDILRSTVEYQKQLKLLMAGVQATDVDVVNKLIENMILIEEAERLGISATQEQIDEFMESSRAAYEFPEAKEMMDEYCDGAGITIEEYFSILESQTPGIVSKQNLKEHFGQQYCQEHGLEYTNFNAPQEMLDAIDACIDELFESHKDEIQYFFDVNE